VIFWVKTPHCSLVGAALQHGITHTFVQLLVIWDQLSETDLQTLEKINVAHVKKLLCASRFTPSKLIHVLARETSHIGPLNQLLLPSMPTVARTTEKREQMRNIWTDFYKYTY
jgi:hypothetical protein